MTVRSRARLLIAVVTGLPLLIAGGAAANTCERLQAELANLPRTVADTASARKYAGAIASQNIQLRKAKSDLGRLGCGSRSVTIVGNRNAEACETLVTVIGKMERNLTILDRKRRQYASGVPDQGARARLVAALQANRCNEPARVTAVAATETLRSMGEEETSGRLFGLMPEGSERLRLPSGSGHGNLRTVCVRTCDGGFFPISSGATPLDFRRDQKVCAMMCPKTETELFYHSLTGTPETGDMTSTVTGRPYSTLTNAFAYRTRARAEGDSCGCDLSAYSREILRREKMQAPGDEATVRGDGDRKDHETSGSITSIRTPPAESEAVEPVPDVTAERPPARVEDRAYDPASSKVRIVGPLFLPADESTIDLGHPATGLN